MMRFALSAALLFVLAAPAIAAPADLPSPPQAEPAPMPEPQASPRSPDQTSPCYRNAPYYCGYPAYNGSMYVGGSWDGTPPPAPPPAGRRAR